MRGQPHPHRALQRRSELQLGIRRALAETAHRDRKGRTWDWELRWLAGWHQAEHLDLPVASELDPAQTESALQRHSVQFRFLAHLDGNDAIEGLHPRGLHFK